MERLLLFNVHGERRITATAGFRTGPLGRGHHGLWGCLGHGEGNLTFLVTLGKIHQVQTGLLLKFFEALKRHLTVGGTRDAQNRLGELGVGIQCRTTRALTGVHYTKFLRHLSDFVLQIVRHVFGGGTDLVKERTHGGVHIVHSAVVAFDGHEVRHVHAGNAHHIGGVLPVGGMATRLLNLTGGVMQQRNRNNVFTSTQVLLRLTRELICESLEGLVVSLGLPRRVNRG